MSLQTCGNSVEWRACRGTIFRILSSGVGRSLQCPSKFPLIGCASGLAADEDDGCRLGHIFPVFVLRISASLCSPTREGNFSFLYGWDFSFRFHHHYQFSFWCVLQQTAINSTNFSSNLKVSCFCMVIKRDSNITFPSLTVNTVKSKSSRFGNEKILKRNQSETNRAQLPFRGAHQSSWVLN